MLKVSTKKYGIMTETQLWDAISRVLSNTQNEAESSAASLSKISSTALNTDELALKRLFNPSKYKKSVTSTVKNIICALSATDKEELAVPE